MNLGCGIQAYQVVSTLVEESKHKTSFLKILMPRPHSSVTDSNSREGPGYRPLKFFFSPGDSGA